MGRAFLSAKQTVFVANIHPRCARRFKKEERRRHLKECVKKTQRARISAVALQ